MEPVDVVEAMRALEADQSAAANSNLGAATSECPDPIVNVGIFFDGTYNDGGDSERLPTNVFRLSGHYKTVRDDIRSASGTCVEEAFRPIYIAGIGTRGNWASNTAGGFAGYGPQGVFDRMEQAVVGLRGAVDEFGGIDRIRELKVDIFGFSRGAATARIFANALAEAGIGKLTIRFLGVFDTVGSFGIPGDSREGYTERPRSMAGHAGMILSPALYAAFNQGTMDLHIHANTAERVFHVTAEDEFRAFFPLSRATPPRSGTRVEVGCPGNHGDIGGSAKQFVTHETVPDTTLAHYTFLADRGWVDGAERTMIHINPAGGDPAMGYRRTVNPGLTRCTLFAMHGQAEDALVPFHPLSSARARDDVSIPPGLQTLAGLLRAGQTPGEAIQRPIRAAYAHQSWGGPGPNMIDIDHVREEYPNQA